MTTPAGPGPTDPPYQESLLDPAAELALHPPGLNPDPLIAVRFLTAVGDGHRWHAIERDPADHAATIAAGGITAAVCGATARITKYGIYDRAAVPVTYGPCRLCAWTVAIAAGSTERELRLITPDNRDARALARAGAPPLLAVNTCRAILARESSPDAGDGLDHPATVQVLAHVTAHRPVVAIHEDCAEDDRCCRHSPAETGAADGGGTWRCDYPNAGALCAACSLITGPWAGEREGNFMEECRVTAPCDALRALAAHYDVPLARTRP